MDSKEYIFIIMCAVLKAVTSQLVCVRYIRFQSPYDQCTVQLIAVCMYISQVNLYGCYKHAAHLKVLLITHL